MASSIAVCIGGLRLFCSDAKKRYPTPEFNVCRDNELSTAHNLRLVIFAPAERR
jgi:hypothetical protein